MSLFKWILVQLAAGIEKSSSEIAVKSMQTDSLHIFQAWNEQKGWLKSMRE